MSTNTRAATAASAQLLLDSAQQDKEAIQKSMQQYKSLPDIYAKAPVYGKLQGALYGIPAGLLAGGATYGIMSMLPWIRKKKWLKAVMSLIAAGGAGVAIGKPVYEKARDLFFEDQAGMPSPWKTYVLDDANKTKIKPSELIDSSMDTWNKVKDDPLNYAKQQLINQLHESQKNNEGWNNLKAMGQAYADAWKQFRQNPVNYLTVSTRGR